MPATRDRGLCSVASTVGAGHRGTPRIAQASDEPGNDPRKPHIASFLRHFLVLLVLLSHPIAGHSAEDAVVLIVNPETEVETLSRDTVRAIFAMRQRTWPDGQAVSVFVLPDDNPVHATFSKMLLDVYPHQLRLAWDRVVFSGTGQAPNHVSSQPEMLKRIASTPGGLGYIERGYLDDSVRVLPLEE